MGFSDRHAVQWARRRAPFDGSPSGGNHQPVIERVQRSRLATFPQLEDVRFTHAWGGTMGIALDGTPSVGTPGAADDV